MLPDRPKGPLLDRRATPEPEVEPIAPQAADAILREALAPYVAQGWHVMDQGPYSARLTREKRNLDLRVDLLGQVETRESGLTPLQESGRLVAWMVLLAMLLVALSLAAALGVL
jgi:hypothetical protein